jgi:hypothetical protein
MLHAEELPVGHLPFAPVSDETDGNYGDGSSVDEVGGPLPRLYLHESANPQAAPEHATQGPVILDDMGNEQAQFPGASQHRPVSSRRAAHQAADTILADRAARPSADELELSTLQQTASDARVQQRVKVDRRIQVSDRAKPAWSSSGRRLQGSAPRLHDAATMISSPAENSDEAHVPRSESSAESETPKALLRIISQ